MTNYSTSVPQSTQETYQHPWYTQQQQLENTTTLESQSQQKPRPETVGPQSTNRSLKGDYWEYWVLLKAVERGAEVFKNASCTGNTDLILRINDQIVCCDVKQMKWDSDKNVWRQEWFDIPDNVYGVAVNPETEEIRWYRNRNRKTFKCPPGLEDFWN